MISFLWILTLNSKSIYTGHIKKKITNLFKNYSYFQREVKVEIFDCLFHLK